MKCSVPGGVTAGGKKMVSCPRWRAVFYCCFLHLRGGAGSCFFFNGGAACGCGRSSSSLLLLRYFFQVVVLLLLAVLMVAEWQWLQE